MPLTRSREDLTNLDRRESSNTCFVDLEGNSNNSNVGPVTRSMSRSNRGQIIVSENLESHQVTASVEEHRSSTTSVEEDRIRQMITDSLTNFRSDLISEIGVIFNNSRFENIQSRSNNFADRGRMASGYQNQSGSNNTPNINENSEKVLNIIRNWRIKFSGRFDDIDVDEFIYRINILTTNTLNGNFELLCKHAYSIFEGKALDWFWKYHQRNENIEWNSLTTALKRQYKSVHSDFDVRDDIRRHKQKPNETFDQYLDTVIAIADKLKTPMSELEFCETVIRNLKPEIRHELLHVNITQISQLRYEVHKHEKFMNEIQINNSFKNQNIRRQVAEIDFRTQHMDREIMNEDAKVCAVTKALICWNCDGQGHSYKDCIKDKLIFCYGCGLKNTYKPNCLKCKQQGNLKRDVLQQTRGHPNLNRK